MDILVKRPASIRWGDLKPSSGRMRGTGFVGVDARSDTGYSSAMPPSARHRLVWCARFLREALAREVRR